MTSPKKSASGNVAANVFNQLKTAAKNTGKKAGSQLKPSQFLKTAGQQIKGSRPQNEPIKANQLKRSKQKGPNGEVPVNQLTDKQFSRIKKQKRSQAMRRYKQIQQELQKYRQKKQQQIPKQVSGKPSFDKENSGKSKKQKGLGPLKEPTSRRKRGILGGRSGRGKLSRKQQQNIGTGELGRGAK